MPAASACRGEALRGPARRPGWSPEDRCSAWRSNASATVILRGSAKGSAMRPRNESTRVCAASAAARTISMQSPITASYGSRGAVPFDQRELGMVQRAALAVPEDTGELEHPRFAGGEQLLAGKFRRGAQIKRRALAGGRNASRSRRRAGATRFPARPGERRSPPPRSPAPRTAGEVARRCGVGRQETAAGRRRPAGPTRARRPSCRACRAGGTGLKKLARGGRIGMLHANDTAGSWSRRCMQAHRPPSTEEPYP